MGGVGLRENVEQHFHELAGILPELLALLDQPVSYALRGVRGEECAGRFTCFPPTARRAESAPLSAAIFARRSSTRSSALLSLACCGSGIDFAWVAKWSSNRCFRLLRCSISEPSVLPMGMCSAAPIKIAGLERALELIQQAARPFPYFLCQGRGDCLIGRRRETQRSQGGGVQVFHQRPDLLRRAPRVGDGALQEGCRLRGERIGLPAARRFGRRGDEAVLPQTVDMRKGCRDGALGLRGDAGRQGVGRDLLEDAREVLSDRLVDAQQGTDLVARREVVLLEQGPKDCRVLLFARRRSLNTGDRIFCWRST